MHLVLNEYGVKHVIVANVTEVGFDTSFNKDEKQESWLQSLHRVSIQN
uniref:GDSL family lipase n=1 Tax=Wolbachia endosymbiont of Oeneis ivallda TaxID=3171168 RepID=A0AAU7YL35_9RICK